MTLTYLVKGGDGGQYGPASLDDLERWIREGRVVGTTLVWRSDTETWKPADEYLELGFELTHALKHVESPAEPVEEEVRLVGFFPRFTAFLADYFVLTAVMTAVMAVLPSSMELKDTKDPWVIIQQRTFWILLALDLGVRGLFHVMFNAHFGGTPGKILIGAKIVAEDGSPIGYRRAIARYFAGWLSVLSLGAGFLFVAFRPDRRALHDLLAGTRVVFIR